MMMNPHDDERVQASVAKIDALLEKSSLGTPAARVARARTPLSRAQRIAGMQTVIETNSDDDSQHIGGASKTSLDEARDRNVVPIVYELLVGELVTVNAVGPYTVDVPSGATFVDIVLVGGGGGGYNNPGAGTGGAGGNTTATPNGGSTLTAAGGSGGTGIAPGSGGGGGGGGSFGSYGGLGGGAGTWTTATIEITDGMTEITGTVGTGGTSGAATNTAVGGTGSAGGAYFRFHAGGLRDSATATDCRPRTE